MKIRTFDGTDIELTKFQEADLSKGAEHCLAKALYWQREYSELLERKVNSTDENKILKDALEQCLYYTAMRDPDINTHKQACDSVESISKEALEKIK